MVKSINYSRDRGRRSDSAKIVAETKSSTKEDTGIIKIVIRHPRPPPQPPNPNRIPAYFLLGHEIIQYIDDYFTLLNLSRSCRTFYSIVRAQTKHRNALFDKLETLTPSQLQQDIAHRHHSNTICSRIMRERSNPGYHNRKMFWVRAERVRLQEQMDTSDLVQYGGIKFVDLITPMFLPCYGCKQLKGSTQFFDHHKTECLSLLGCRPELRRCIDCDFDRPPEYFKDEYDYDAVSWFDPVASLLQRRTRLHTGDRRVYLIDMPLGYPGFRLHCQVCKSSKWARTRPTKTREVRHVCEECFQKGLSATKVPGKKNGVFVPEKAERRKSGKESVALYDQSGLEVQSVSEPGHRLGGFGFEVLRNQA